MVAPLFAFMFRRPQTRRLALACALWWTSTAMVGLAVILAVHASTGSLSACGWAVAAYGLGAAALAPLRGGLLDRLGPRRMLPMFGTASAVGLASVAVGAAEGEPLSLLVAASALAGITAPPLIATARATWPRILASDELRPAYAYTATSGDAAQVAGPALVGGIAATASPSWSLGVCAGAGLIASLLAASESPTSSDSDRSRRERRQSPLASLGQRVLIAADLALGFALGLLDIALPAFALEKSTAPMAGILLAALGLGSIVGGISFARRRPRSPGREYARLLGLLALGLAPIWLAPTAWAMALLLLVAGTALAPANTALFEALDRIAPRRSEIQAFTWLTTANSAGIALGAAVAGWLVVHAGLVAALALPSPIVAVASLVAWWGRDRLGPRQA